MPEKMADDLEAEFLAKPMIVAALRQQRAAGLREAAAWARRQTCTCAYVPGAHPQHYSNCPQGIAAWCEARARDMEK